MLKNDAANIYTLHVQTVLSTLTGFEQIEFEDTVLTTMMINWQKVLGRRIESPLLLSHCSDYTRRA